MIDVSRFHDLGLDLVDAKGLMVDDAGFDERIDARNLGLLGDVLPPPVHDLVGRGYHLVVILQSLALGLLLRRQPLVIIIILILLLALHPLIVGGLFMGWRAYLKDFGLRVYRTAENARMAFIAAAEAADVLFVGRCEPVRAAMSATGGSRRRRGSSNLTAV